MTVDDCADGELVSASVRGTGFDAGWPGRAELRRPAFVEADAYEGWPARSELRDRYPELNPKDDRAAWAELDTRRFQAP